jgi:hypothetical protein
MSDNGAIGMVKPRSRFNLDPYTIPCKASTCAGRKKYGPLLLLVLLLLVVLVLLVLLLLLLPFVVWLW